MHPMGPTAGVSPLVLGRGGSWAPSPPACPASPSHLLAPHEVMQAPEPELRGQGEGRRLVNPLCHFTT